MKTYSTSHGNRKFKIYVGSNSKENWDLIDDSDIFDLWLHIDDKPSCHVIIKEELEKTTSSIKPTNPTQNPTQNLNLNPTQNLNLNPTQNPNLNLNPTNNFGYPIEIIKEGSNYCKVNSKYKNEKLKIVYTTIENIKKGKVIGSVIITNQKNIFI